jgi:hypothetical protein
VNGVAKVGGTGAAPSIYTSLIVGQRPAGDNVSSLWLTPSAEANRGWILESYDNGSNDYFDIYDRTANKERLRLDSSGNVGIGTTSPSYKLHVKDVSGSYPLYIESTSSNSTGTFTAANGLRTSVIAGSSYGNAFGISNNVSLTSANANAYGLYNTVDTSTGTGNNNAEGLHNEVTSRGTGSGYGIRNTVSTSSPGTGGYNYGLFSYVSGATNNYGIYIDAEKNYFTGKVGIGTAEPQSSLDVWNITGGDTRVSFTNSGVQVTNAEETASSVRLGSVWDSWPGVSTHGDLYLTAGGGADPKNIYFSTEQGALPVTIYGNTSSNPRLDVDGVVKIGPSGKASSAGTSLIVGKRVLDNYAAIWLSPYSGADRGWVVEAKDDGIPANTNFNIYDNVNGGQWGAVRLDINSSGAVTIPNLGGSGNIYVCADNAGKLYKGGAVSDIRLKKNIVSISDQMDVLGSLNKLRGVYYNWDTSVERVKDFGDKREVGMIAQDVEKVLPELVGTDKDGYKSLDYQKMSGYLIEVCKAQQKEIEGQKKQLEEQKKINEELKTRLDKLEEKLAPAVGR